MSHSQNWLPPYFTYKGGQLHIEKVSLDAIAVEFGTPCYVYAANSIREAYNRYQTAFAEAELDLSLCYAVKANSNLAILRLLSRLGAGADVVSGGELFRANAAGIPPAKIVFAGVGKTAAEIDFALTKHIRAFNIESAGELALLEQRAQASSTLSIAISIRCNPDVAADTHPYITTGTNNNKFGVTFAQARELAGYIARSDVLQLHALQMHIGSQLLTIQPLAEAFRRLLILAAQVEEQTGQPLKYLDIGGGLGVRYTDEVPAQPAALAQAIGEIMAAHGRYYPLVAEPGRYLVAEAGTLLTQVLYLKSQAEVNFAIVDAAMNDLLRPALYQAKHQIVPLLEGQNIGKQTYEVVGPVCESGDWLGHEVNLPKLESGARLAILSAGAYGFAMASNYNSRLRPAEVLVDGNRVELIRRRETFEDLIAAEL